MPGRLEAAATHRLAGDATVADNGAVASRRRLWIAAGAGAIVLLAAWAGLKAAGRDEFGFLDGLGPRRVVLYEGPGLLEYLLVVPAKNAARVPELMRHELVARRHWVSLEPQSGFFIFRSPSDSATFATIPAA